MLYFVPIYRNFHTPYLSIDNRYTYTETNAYTVRITYIHTYISVCLSHSVYNFNLFVFAVTFVNKAFHEIDNDRMQLVWNVILVANILKNTMKASMMIITCFFLSPKEFPAPYANISFKFHVDVYFD